MGRYQSVNEWLIAPQVQPTVAWKVNDWLSVGGGPAFTLGYLQEKKRVANVDPARGDGMLSYSDTDFAVQGNFGIMIEPDKRTRVGLRYLSEAKLNFKDGLQLSNVGPVISRAKGASLKLGVRMPQTVNVALFHQLTDQWALLGDIGWESWSRFGEINAQVLPDGSSTNVDLDTRDVWHFGIGAQYRYTPRWLLSAGFSYDTSMSSDANRPIILPVGKMYRYGAGVEYNKRDDLTIGAGLDVVWEGIGGGTLHFQGKSYKFKTDGLKLGGFGVNHVKLTGDVYDLKNIADFAGAYGVAEAGATLGNASKGDFVMKNDKGVILHLKSAAQGIALDLGVEGLKITME